MNPGDATNPGDSPNPPPSGSRPQKDLILDAIQQATPRSGSRPGTFAGDLPAPDAFAGYEVLREIHRGGQGVVYQAIQKATRRKVAIKLLHGGPFSGSTGRSRFEREVQILGQLNHPNIVRIHDSGATPDGSFYYVMDYISGRSLDEQITDKRLSVDETLLIFAKICDAMNAAHLKGIIHRDLKPSNIRIDPNGEPVVVDFGLAKLALPDAIEDQESTGAHLMTLTGQFIGSLPWASPEQADGHPGNIDVRTDVYSLGVVLYQMLTGQFPYKVLGNMRDVLDNILRAEPAKPSTVRRQIDDEVETIVLKCLSKERDRRYQSAGELGRDLRRYLNGEPIEAKRDSTAYMLTKTLSRYRLPVTAAVVALLCLVGFSIAMTVLYRQAERAERQATSALAATQAAEAIANAQRARAETNFKAGHELAMVMITSINDEITYLRGATRARELLLKEAKAYLERLRTEAGDDPGLLLDLAKAYERVGDLQGVVYMRRLGETTEADRNFAKAKEIRDQLAVRLPLDPRVHAASARSLYRLGGAAQLKGDLPAAAASYEAAISSYDRAMELARATPSGAPVDPKWLDNLAWTQRAMGDVLRLQARGLIQSKDQSSAEVQLRLAGGYYDSAEKTWGRVLTVDPHNEDAHRGMAVLDDSRALILMLRGSRESAAAKLAGDAGKANEAIAAYGRSLGFIAQARELHTKVHGRFLELGASNTASGEIRRSSWVSTRNIALTHSEEARIHAAMAELGQAGEADAARASREAALALHRQTVEVARRIGDEDTRSLEARRDLGGCLLTVATELRALKRADEASKVFDEVITLRREILAADPVERHRQDLAVGLLRLAQFEIEQAAAAATDQQARLKSSAREHLTASADLLHPLKDAGVAGVDPMLEEAQTALRGLP